MTLKKGSWSICQIEMKMAFGIWLKFMVDFVLKEGFEGERSQRKAQEPRARSYQGFQKAFCVPFLSAAYRPRGIAAIRHF